MKRPPTLQNDMLQTLAKEWNTTEEYLTQLAVERLLDDVMLFRQLRAGEFEFESQ